MTGHIDKKENTMPLERINIHKLAEPVGPYVHVVRHGDTLYTSGFTAFGSEAQQGSIVLQASAIFDQLRLITEQQETSFENLIKVTIFVTDLLEVGELRALLTSIYGDHKPASSLIKIDQLFALELKIEIEAIFAC